jgi:putative transposase
MKRRRPLQVVQRDADLLPRIQQLKVEHPFWSYRRIWAYLRFVEQLPVNKKRVLRVMREHHLVVTPKRRLKPKLTKPNEWWGIDMTKVLVERFGWVDIVLVLDWYTKTIVGHYAGLQCTAQKWLAALDMAVNRQYPEGAQGKGLALPLELMRALAGWVLDYNKHYLHSALGYMGYKSPRQFEREYLISHGTQFTAA